MTELHFDAVVLGSGPGAMAAAVTLGASGKKTALLEPGEYDPAAQPGSIAINSLLSVARENQALAKDRPSRSIIWQRAQVRLRKAADRAMTRNKLLLKSAGVTHVTGKLVDISKKEVRFLPAPAQATAGGTEITYAGHHLIIESAGLPSVTGPRAGAMRPNDALHMPTLPEAIMVEGAGPIGVELATVFAAFGARVRLVEAEDRVLAGFDPDISEGVKQVLLRLGIMIICSKPSVPAEVGEAVIVTHHLPGKRAAGERAGGVHYIGDPDSKPIPAHQARYEGGEIARSILGLPAGGRQVSPWVVGSIPEIAVVGQSEMQLQAEKTAYRVYSAEFAQNPKSWCEDVSFGFAKILVGDDSVILGGKLIGPHSSSLIIEVADAILAGARIDDFKRSIRPHPSFAEIWSDLAPSPTPPLAPST